MDTVPEVRLSVLVVDMGLSECERDTHRDLVVEGREGLLVFVWEDW